MRIDTEVSEIELRKNWFFQKFKCKISFYNIWEPKMSQLIVIGSHWGFAGCSLVSQWGSLRVIWWSFGGHSGFKKLNNFEFGNKFDYLICHSVLCNVSYIMCTRVGRKLKNLSDFLCHGDVNIGYRIILNSEIASSLPCAL